MAGPNLSRRCHRPGQPGTAARPRKVWHPAVSCRGERPLLVMIQCQCDGQRSSCRDVQATPGARAAGQGDSAGRRLMLYSCRNECQQGSCGCPRSQGASAGCEQHHGIAGCIPLARNLCVGLTEQSFWLSLECCEVFQAMWAAWRCTG